jgi:hypothetical protein
MNNQHHELPLNIEMPLANASFMDVNDVATWNFGVPDIQLADNKRCDVILQTRVANREHTGISQDLFTKECDPFCMRAVKILPQS